MIVNMNKHDLIRKFGSPGKARNALAMMQAALVATEPFKGEVLDCEELAPQFMEAIGSRSDERFAAIFLDQARRQIGGIKVFEGGSRTRTTLYPRILFKEALERDATGIILSHNHPGDTPLPSPQDRDLTRRVAEIGESLEIRLLDHILVTTREHVSFRRSGWM